MSIKPFMPQSVEDLKGRLDELWGLTNDAAPYSDSLRGEVLDLIWHCQQKVPFSIAEKQAVEQAKQVLNAGNARLALVKLGQALESHLP
ncbi:MULTISPECIES: hypothetical protein [Burkholderia]|uniref:hypothetical protein n=1 Tax=Burkholderia TaxID=32008 RepID=UPI00075C4936|nr:MULTISPECIES: hypothetical protein [Burkholderia]AOJ69161.1 hypothetical protein WS78_10630 [Burkholderia savannae]KVG39800.1 hypothetical protein WS77_19180 [Burkholderia sp. MSMB0265]KVG85789.1 hypothetical protein WS81_31490 [Burkholderia sp. MSMB2040]KVG92196.1 hypothetical protein WS82_12155 [Burkholderia sp. MSMB2041]KVG95725.1 hypothetical protein WS83_04080 [Burkholderia sp. MSMB2042]